MIRDTLCGQINKSKAGLNSYRLSSKEWMQQTGAIGIVSRAGRYGGTYAHKDIAFEFAMWISPEFKVYLIREFQRLKEEEQKLTGWSAKRELSKINSLPSHKISRRHKKVVVGFANYTHNWRI